MRSAHSALFATALLASCVSVALPALAGGGDVTSNTTVATNVAAGIGNQASQELLARQSRGAPPAAWGPVDNRIVAGNLAAGIGNSAVQSLDLGQRGGRPGATSNLFYGRNPAAGLGIASGQGVYGRQR